MSHFYAKIQKIPNLFTKISEIPNFRRKSRKYPILDWNAPFWIKILKAPYFEKKSKIPQFGGKSREYPILAENFEKKTILGKNTPFWAKMPFLVENSENTILAKMPILVQKYSILGKISKIPHFEWKWPFCRKARKYPHFGRKWPFWREIRNYCILGELSKTLHFGWTFQKYPIWDEKSENTSIMGEKSPFGAKISSIKSLNWVVWVKKSPSRAEIPKLGCLDQNAHLRRKSRIWVSWSKGLI